VKSHCQLEKHPVGDVEPAKFVVQYHGRSIRSMERGEEQREGRKGRHLHPEKK